MSRLRDAIKGFSYTSKTQKIALLSALVLLIAYFISVSIKGGDFVSFLEASTKMWEGKNIYDPPYINLRYSYSPFWAMILVPFALLPKGVGAFIWLWINVFLLWRTIVLLRTQFGITFSDRRRDRILWFLILLYMSRYIELNFHHVQMTIFLLWLIMESIVFADNHKEIKAGILIGLGAIIKIMPIVIVPYFIFRRRFIAAFSSLVTIAFAFLLPVMFVGKERFIALNTSWFSILRPDSPEFRQDVVWFMPQNLSAFLYRVLMNIGAPYTKNILTLDYEQATSVITIIIGLLIVFTLYFLNTLPFKKPESKVHSLYEVSYIVLLIPLIFPHQMKYAFYFVLPAICCLTKVVIYNYDKESERYRYVLTVCLTFLSFVLCTMTTDLIIGIHYSEITQHFKTITVGTLLLIPALALNRKYFIETL